MNLMKIFGSPKSPLQTNHHQDKNKGTDKDKDTDEVNYDTPVDDETLLPRCEFFHRFDSTSLFQNDVRRAGVYTRGADASYVQGNRNAINFIPTPLTDGNNTTGNSITAHTGGFANPYVLPKYAKNIRLNKHNFDPKYQAEPKLYDELLTYKLGLCNHIATEFTQKVPHADLGGSRYRAKIFSTIPTLNDFKDADIIVRKWRAKGTIWVSLYTVIQGKVTEISLSGNQELVDRIAEIRVGSDRKLEELLKEFQPWLIQKNLHPNRDMQGVYCSNKYPCVLVRFTPKITDKAVSKGELETIYKRYNHLLMAYFMAIVDYNAYQAGINIEMLRRSGFGQNNPGIAVTDKSFRINIGLIPKAYADIIVKSLVQLHDLFRLLENAQSHQHLQMAAPLKNKLDKAREVGFDKPALPGTYWKALWEKGSHGAKGRILLHELIERERDRPELLANFVLKTIISNPATFFNNPVIAESPLEKMFQLIGYSSDDASVKLKWKNKYVIHQITSEALKQKVLQDGIHKTKDNKYFQVINNRTPKIKELELNPGQTMPGYKTGQQLTHSLCTTLFKGYVYPQPCKISVNSKPVLQQETSFNFAPPSHKKVSDDPALLAIVKKLSNGLAANVPDHLELRDLYKFLEASHIRFICEKRTRTSDQLNKTPEWGSDSETEVPGFVKTKTIFAKKVIVANGMLSINLSYYAARSAVYLVSAIKDMESDDDLGNVFDSHRNGMKVGSGEITINCNNTYFETISGDPGNPLCLDAATDPPKQRKNAKADILVFDLNSFKADFIAQKADLSQQLKVTRPTVVVLDHTSSTTDEIRHAIKTIYAVHPGVSMVLLVTSGLKNEQGGSDNNPYGKLTVLSLANQGETNTLTNFIYDEITALTSPRTEVQLSKKALLPKAAHAIRQSYKDRGFTTTAHAILHNDSEDMSDTEALNTPSDNKKLNHIDRVVYVLTLKHIQDNYPNEFDNLIEMGCSHREIMNLYDESVKKFKAMANKKVRDLVTRSDDVDLFDNLADIYDKDKACFRDILNDENELAYDHGIDKIYTAYKAMVKKYGRVDSDYMEIDIMGLVNRQLNDIESESENSYSDSEGYATEGYSGESDGSYSTSSAYSGESDDSYSTSSEYSSESDDSYSATSSSEM